MVEALTYSKLEGGNVRCQVCQRYCLITKGLTGFCQIKKNNKGKLDSLNYGLTTGIQIDPIEKKPFYHFLPGELVPSIGGVGCNFRCKQCLNYWCSWGFNQGLIASHPLQGKPRLVGPREVITEVKESGYKIIAFTYNEPVVWAEFVLDTAKLAKKEEIKTLFVTNGSWSKETLDKIGPFIDAANVDLKGFSEKTYARQGAFLGKIPDMLIYAQNKHRIFLELTTLLIPGINDSSGELLNMTKWITENLGPDTPWHLAQFDPKLAPDPEFQKIPPTSIEQLKKAADIGKKHDLSYIYIWAPNSGGSVSDTVCPKCKKIVIRRSGWEPIGVNVDKNGKCKFCNYNLNIRI